ncbi:unnamed protein product [Rotaria sp. Silwood2]|nr:unnamed protein product [Rotaria sp. Silwood2]
MSLKHFSGMMKTNHYALSAFNATWALIQLLVSVGLYVLSIVLSTVFTANLTSDLTILKSKSFISGIDDIKNEKVPFNSFLSPSSSINNNKNTETPISKDLDIVRTTSSKPSQEQNCLHQQISFQGRHQWHRIYFHEISKHVDKQYLAAYDFK